MVSTFVEETGGIDALALDSAGQVYIGSPPGSGTRGAFCAPPGDDVSLLSTDGARMTGLGGLSWAGGASSAPCWTRLQCRRPIFTTPAQSEAETPRNKADEILILYWSAAVACDVFAQIESS